MRQKLQQMKIKTKIKMIMKLKINIDTIGIIGIKKK